MSAKQRRYPCSGPNEFRISLQAYWQINIFLCVTSQSWRVLKSWYLGGGPQFRRCFADGLNQKFNGHSMPCKDLVFILSLFFFRKYAEAKACVKNATLTLCNMKKEQVEVVNFYCDTFNPFCFNLSDPPMVKRSLVPLPRVSRESDPQLPAITPTRSVKGSAEVKSRGGGQSTSLASYRFVIILSVVVLIRTVS